MPRMMLQNLGTQVRKKRGHRGLRETAQEIGASAPALCRIESGKLPNIQTFARRCRWLEADPAEVLNVARRTTGTTARAPLKAQRFSAPKPSRPETVQAPAAMIMRAQRNTADPPGDGRLEETSLE